MCLPEGSCLHKSKNPSGLLCRVDILLGMTVWFAWGPLPLHVLNRTGSRMFIGGNAFFLWLIEGGKYIRVHGSFEDSCMFAQLQNSYISITVIHMYNYIYTLYIYTLYIYTLYIHTLYIYIHMHYST